MTQIYQVECNDALNINEWLRNNPDIEVVDIQASLNEIGELITVVYKIDMEDNCTKCTVKPVVKEHMCDECYTEHNEWLRELSASKQDDDQWYTLYESKA